MLVGTTSTRWGSARARVTAKTWSVLGGTVDHAAAVNRAQARRVAGEAEGGRPGKDGVAAFRS